MPNRVVREGILDSELVNKLSWAGEVFYRRLMSMLDDYGRCDGRTSIMRSKLYPLKLDKVSEADVVKWLTECVDAELVSIYHVNGKPYLQMFNFNQTVRIKKMRFPEPAYHVQADASRCVSETESETETLSETESPADAELLMWPTFDDFWNKYEKKVDRPKCESKWKKIKQVAREKIMLHLDDYVKSTPDVTYRKNPATYLNNESWENEIIKPKESNGKLTNIKGRANLTSLIEDHARKYGGPSTGEPPVR
jgi:hypothetical protein